MWPDISSFPDHIMPPQAPFSPLGGKVTSRSWRVALQYSSFKAPQECHLLLILLSQLKPHLCEAFPDHRVTLTLHSATLHFLSFPALGAL